jgi:hypothetical protein
MHPSLTHQIHMQTANALQYLAPSYLNPITVTLLYSNTEICCSQKCYCKSSHSNNKQVAYLLQKWDIQTSLLFCPADKRNSGCRGQYLASITAQMITITINSCIHSFTWLTILRYSILPNRLFHLQIIHEYAPFIPSFNLRLYLMFIAPCSVIHRNNSLQVHCTAILLTL